MDMDKYEFFIDHDKGVVVARLSRIDFLEMVKSTAMKKILSKYSNTPINRENIWFGTMNEVTSTAFNIWSKKRQTEKSIKAIARCNFEDGDTFDVNKGMYIAADRMDMKITDWALDFLEYFYNYLADFVNDMVDRGNALATFYNTTHDNIEKLTK